MSNVEVSSSNPSSSFQRLAAENARLREELNECTTQLMVLSRDDDQVPDATVLKGCGQLRDSIDHWVDDVLYDETRNFRETWDRLLRVEMHEGNLESLGLYTSSTNPTIRKQFRMDKSSWERLIWLGKQPYCNCVIVSLVIWRFLERDVFGSSFPNGMANEDAEFFEDILEVLTRDDGGNIGPESKASRWKSQTLTAMVKSPAFQERRKKESNRLFKSLINKLEIWISPSSAARTQLRDSILEPAIDLHNAVTCSKQMYRLEGPLSPQQTDLEKNPRKWILRNISTWRSIPAEKDIVPFHCLFPGLYKRNAKNDVEKLELLKPVVIVYRPEELRPTASLTMPLPEHDDSRQRAIQPLQTKAVSLPQLERKNQWKWPFQRT